MRQKMSATALQHLTTDELDALLDGAGSTRVTSHLETCVNCLATVELDRRLVGALSALPALDPAPDFEERVMARVIIRPAQSPIAVAAPSPRSIAARRRALVGSVLAGCSLVAGFAWAVTHPAAAALGGFAPVINRNGEALLASLQSMATTASSLASPGRMLLALVAISLVYVIALTGFQRLLTEPATDARW
jgi:hypothetical protein